MRAAGRGGPPSSEREGDPVEGGREIYFEVSPLSVGARRDDYLLSPLLSRYLKGEELPTGRLIA